METQFPDQEGLEQTVTLWPEQVGTDRFTVNAEPSALQLSAQASFTFGAVAFNVAQPLSFIAIGDPGLESRVQELEREVAELKTRLEAQEEEEVIVLRDISREQAKDEIRVLFKAGETLYYSDIVRRLGLDVSLVVELCDELESEGEVETLGDSAKSR
ncbi:MAG: hypothetical protein Q8O40_00985 [Chloroflexota bacterium]|nr:hypothetical protein [Chloroflexota bacterium]